MIKSLYIRNFRGFRDFKIDGFKRINLLIGIDRTNKSNILEALSSFTIPFLRENTSKGLDQLIRLESETELFYNGNYHDPARIETELGFVQFHMKRLQGYK